MIQRKKIFLWIIGGEIFGLVVAISIVVFLLTQGRIAFLGGGWNEVAVTNQRLGDTLTIKHVRIGNARGAAVVVQPFGGIPSSFTFAFTKSLPAGTYTNLRIPVDPARIALGNIKAGDTLYVTLYERGNDWADPDYPDLRTPLRDWFGNIVTAQFRLQ